ncbi:hypothetical protein GCM10012275_45470 [Longimycelium tulufanense]|uniref:Uncharacterized protein n=1 Tax=Longimycelium tulufanense TaxID=907463 RepID=A0A8J3CBI1_9PSEU|nr:hypothetical protein [Longimycelium tulufanense]GGM69851.1 hypothetical protein GCM10012275_45470 [Longimycelium tulufanense]
MNAQQTTTAAGPQPPAGVPGHPPRLHQPWRAYVAVAELVLAALLVAAAVWAWRRGMVVVEFPPFRDGEAPQRVVRYLGQWLASGVGLGLLAGVALLDAIRQLVLSSRVRGRRRRH